MNTKPLFSKTTLIALAFLVSAGIGVYLLVGTGNTSQEAAPPQQIVRPVKVVSLSETALNETRSFPGLVNPSRETNLAFRVSGPLVDFDVRIGAFVEAGEVIARIDPRDFEINLRRLKAALGEAQATIKAMKRGARPEDIARLEAELAAAKARSDRAQKDFQRQENLLAARAVAQARYDEAEAAFDTAKANVEVLVQELKKARSGSRSEDIEAAEAGIRRLSSDIKNAQHALEDTRLKAPFSGYVSRRYVENYENIQAGAPVVSFIDLSSVEVHTAIPEDLVIRRSAIAKIYCTLDAYPDQRFETTVKEIGRKTDSANQSYPVTAILKIPQDLIVEPGMAATVFVALNHPATQHGGFTLPAGAVFADTEGNPCVWRVDMETLRVIKTAVTTGKLSGDTVQIVTGLNAGDRVVTAGTRFLQENQEIRIFKEIEGGIS